MAAVVSGMIVVERTDGVLVHFDRVGYVLVGTTLITLSMMYFINRRITALGPASPAAATAIAIEKTG